MSEDFNDSVKSLNLVDTKLNSVDENVQLKFEVFKVDSTIEGIIIVYFESPNSIYVRWNQDISLLNALSKEIDEYVNNECHNEVTKEDFAVGDYVLEFNHSILMWSRAQIIQFLETKEKNLVLLKYIDHGYTTVSKISL